MIRPRREELPSVIPFIAGSTQVYPGTGIPRDLPLYGLLLKLEGRMTVSAQTVAGNYFPEFPSSLIRRIRLGGNKAGGGGSVQLVNVRGEEAYRMTRFFMQYIPVGQDVLPLAGSGGTAQPAGLAATANGTFDFRVFYWVPVAPPLVTLKDRVQGLLNPAIFSQLDLAIDFGSTPGNIASGFTNSIFALTAFGSATGSPAVTVHRVAALAKDLPVNRFHYLYSSRQIALNGIGTTFADQKLADINAGNLVRFLMMRQYSETAGQPGQQDQLAGASLARIGDNSNVGIFRWRVKVNGTEKLRAQNTDLQEFNRQDYDLTTLMPQGYSLIDWTFLNQMDDAFDTRGFGGAAVRFELFGDALNLTATDKIDILTCEKVPIEV